MFFTFTSSHHLIPPLHLLIFTISQLQPISSQSTVTITLAPAIPSTAPSFVDPAAFTSAILNSTNVYRSAYNASSVRWNSTLEDFASSYLAANASSDSDSDDDDGGSGNNLEKCTMQHSGGPYGENLALGCSTAGSCVDMWAAEAPLYDYAAAQFTHDSGHFTQLVWRDTTDVGCAAHLCPGNYGWYLACEYWPRGNIVGAFGEEVGEPVEGDRKSVV